MKLLLIDDQKDVTLSLKEAIEPGGHECVMYSNPRKAIEKFKQDNFDAIITDYKMPGMNGIDVLKEAQQQKPGLPVIILTGFADTDNAIEAVNHGAYAFMRKPIDLKTFLNTLEDIETKFYRHPNVKTKYNKLSKENQILVKEIHHRIKNNLQLINSLIKLQQYHISNQEAKDILSKTYQRIQAIAMVHEKLYSSENFVGLNLEKYIKQQTKDLLFSAPDNIKIKTKFNLNPIYVSINDAVPWGIVIYELINNAVLHAFENRKNKDNTITINLHRNKSNRIELSVYDNGVGFPDSFDIGNIHTLGLNMVSLIVQTQLEGTMTIEKQSETCIHILV